MLSEGPEATSARPSLDAQGALPAPERRALRAPSLPQVDKALLERLGVRAIIVSGDSTLIDDYDPDTLAPLVEVIRETRTPPLGLCGGDQLIGPRSASPRRPWAASRPGKAIPAGACGRDAQGMGPVHHADLRKRPPVRRPRRDRWWSSSGTSGRRRPRRPVSCDSPPPMPAQSRRSATKAGCSTACSSIPSGTATAIRMAGSSSPIFSGWPASPCPDRKRPRWPEPRPVPRRAAARRLRGQDRDLHDVGAGRVAETRRNTWASMRRARTLSWIVESAGAEATRGGLDP